MTKRTFELAAALVVAAVLSGCGSSKAQPRYDRLEFSEISLAPDAAQLDMSGITLAEGIAVKAVVHAFDTKGRELAPLQLSSQDPRILGVDYGPDPNSFIFYGGSVGQTQIKVVISGRQVGSVDADVIGQDQ